MTGSAEVSGSSPLTQRLVEAAAVALNAGSEQQAMLRHGGDAKAVTVAVLHELGRGAFLLRPDVPGTAGFVTAGEVRQELVGLAESVERGDTT